MALGLGVLLGVAVAVMRPWGSRDLGEVDLTPAPIVLVAQDADGAVDTLRSASPIPSPSIDVVHESSLASSPSSVIASAVDSPRSDPNAELIAGALLSARDLLSSKDLAAALVEARATCDSVPLDPVTAEALSEVCVRWVAAAIYRGEYERLATHFPPETRAQIDSLDRRRFCRQTALGLTPDLPRLVQSGRVKVTASRIAGHSGKSPLAHSSIVWKEDGLRFGAQHGDWSVVLDVPAQELAGPAKAEFARHWSGMSRRGDDPNPHKEK